MNDSLIRPGQFVELSVDEFQATTTTSRWPRPSIWRGRRLRPTKPPWPCSKSKLTPERVSKSKCFHTRRWPLSSITTTFSAATGKYRRQRKWKVTDSNDWTKKSGIHIDAEFWYPFFLHSTVFLLNIRNLDREMVSLRPRIIQLYKQRQFFAQWLVRQGINEQRINDYLEEWSQENEVKTSLGYRATGCRPAGGGKEFEH